MGNLIRQNPLGKDWIETLAFLNKATGKWDATACMKKRVERVIERVAVSGFDTPEEAEKEAKAKLEKTNG